MIDRRSFLGTVAVGVLALPQIGEALAGAARRVPRIGVLGEANPIPWMVRTPVVDIECRWAGTDQARLARLASELLAREVDVIVALGVAAARAASRTTTSVPIVVVGDGPLGDDTPIASLARSVRNITWLSAPSELRMAQQRLRVLGRLVPGLRRVAVLFDPDTATSAGVVARLAGRTSGPIDDVLALPARSIEDVERVFVGLARRAVDGLLVVADTLFTVHATRLVELTASAALPAAYGARVFVDAGGLMAIYGDTGETIRRTAAIVARILAGEAPVTLSPPAPPQPRLALNVPAATRLGLHVPPALLARADALAVL